MLWITSVDHRAVLQKPVPDTYKEKCSRAGGKSSFTSALVKKQNKTEQTNKQKAPRFQCFSGALYFLAGELLLANNYMKF